MTEVRPTESDQVAQRRANFEALVRSASIRTRARSSGRTRCASWWRRYGGGRATSSTAERVETRTAGRILAIRSFGKANFLAISDGESQIQVYIRQDSVSERDFSIFKLLDFGDFVGVEGHVCSAPAPTS